MPDAADLRAARQRLEGHAHRTPVLTSRQLDARAGARLFFKCENLQRVGAFKFRGAFNTVSSLDDETKARGVVTHSSGNHAQAVALAARLHDVAAHIVMPEGAIATKVDAVRGYGAEVIRCAPNSAARESTAAQVVERTGGHLVHPFDDPRVIAGQASAAAELLEQVPDLDTLLVPIGGGGLASGSALTAHFGDSAVAVWGAEPTGADDAKRSLDQGTRQPMNNPQTIADGLRTGLSELTFGIIQRHIEGIATSDDDATIDAMRLVWQRMKMIIEPSCAVPVACALAGDIPGQRIGIILSGGNVDLDNLPWHDND